MPLRIELSKIQSQPSGVFVLSSNLEHLDGSAIPSDLNGHEPNQLCQGATVTERVFSANQISKLLT